MAAQITVYRTESCPYCVAAKQLLQKRGYTFDEVYLDRDASRMAELKEQYGWRTVPMIVIGDTFVFGGEVVRYESLVEDQVYVSRANDKDAKVPSYMGGKFPLSTYLAERVRNLLADKRAWSALPEQVRMAPAW